MKNKIYTSSKENSKEGVKYRKVREKLYFIELSKCYRTYGIAALSNGKCVAFVSDISTSSSAVRGLAKRCNKNSLDPVHLVDIVDDFLAE